MKLTICQLALWHQFWELRHELLLSCLFHKTYALTVQISRYYWSVPPELHGRSHMSEWKAHVPCWSRICSWSSPKSAQNLCGITANNTEKILFITYKIIYEIQNEKTIIQLQQPLHMWNRMKSATHITALIWMAGAILWYNLWLHSARAYLTRFPDHDIVTVTVPYSQNICGYTVACAGEGEFLNGLIQFFPEKYKIIF